MNTQARILFALVMLAVINALIGLAILICEGDFQKKFKEKAHTGYINKILMCLWLLFLAMFKIPMLVLIWMSPDQTSKKPR